MRRTLLSGAAHALLSGAARRGRLGTAAALCHAARPAGAIIEAIMATVSRAAVRGVDLAAASKIIDHALGEARRRNLRPMTLAVLDAGGDLVAFKREDGTGIRRFDVVMGKAFGSL